MSMHWPLIERSIRLAGHQSFAIERVNPVSGGCIHQTYVIQDRHERFFVKLSSYRRSNVFVTEAHNLKALAANGPVRVPQVICQGEHQSGCFLVLEYLAMEARDGGSDRRLGRQLALLHDVPHPDFGWFEDNYIGSTPQINGIHTDWVAFWRDCRLGFQLELARNHGYDGRLQRLGERVMAQMTSLFKAHRPDPSLLHGDLWAGNALALRSGEPVIFDPACYWGDREADLAMTELFGGFSPDFYAAYHEIHPRQPGYEVRKQLYNLYHVLNHLNLFGRGYLGRAEEMMERLLVEIH